MDDVSAIVDLASSAEPAPTPEVTPTETPEVTTPDTPTPEGETAPEIPETPEGEITPPDPDPKVDGRTNPAAVRSALKAFRDSDPKNAAITRVLNDSYGRWEAAKQVFPGGVTEMRNVKSFIDANGGVEGLTTLHETIKQVNETDGLLYAGDPRVLDNIIEDMRKEGKLDSFSKLAGPFLDKLRGLDEKSYFNTLKPHFYQGLVDTGVPNVVGQLVKLLSNATPDVEGAKGLLTEFTTWLNGLRDSVERNDRTKLDPERQAFEQERTQFASEKQKEFKTGVATAADQYNNESLGKALRPFVKLPFFKNLTDKGKLSLAREIKSTLLEELGADTPYKSQMDAFFGAKAPDKSRISQFHNSKVDTMAQRIVKQVIENRYPDYAKRAAVAAKPGVPVVPKPGTEQPVAGKPEFVKSKPKWEELDMEKDAQRMLFIVGKGYRKSDGKLITWNPKYK